MASKYDVLEVLQTKSPICHWCEGKKKFHGTDLACTLCHGTGVSPVFQTNLDLLIEEVKLLREKVSNGPY